MEIKQKGRPKITRSVGGAPQIMQFSPRGRPGRPDEIQLSLDQFEAIKLADYEGLDQTQGSLRMGISRATFGRVLKDARKKISDALVNGKIIKIFGGQVSIKEKDK